MLRAFSLGPDRDHVHTSWYVYVASEKDFVRSFVRDMYTQALDERVKRKIASRPAPKKNALYATVSSVVRCTGFATKQDRYTRLYLTAYKLTYTTCTVQPIEVIFFSQTKEKEIIARENNASLDAKNLAPRISVNLTRTCLP
jgi:hypothetical protein